LKEIFVFGGPNGAGKTTMASRLLPNQLGVVEFVNADEITRGQSPFDWERSAIAAGTAMIERIDMIYDEPRWRSIEEATR
jgi:predicted ABC-type ATPase